MTGTANNSQRLDCAQDDKRRYTVEGKPDKLKLVECFYLIKKARKLYRRLTGCTNHYLADDKRGHQFGDLLFQLGIPDDVAAEIMPWTTEQERCDRRKIVGKATCRSVARFGQMIGLTAAKRREHKAWWTGCCDPEETDRLNAVARREAQRKRRTERAARLQATDRPPREVVVLATIDRLSRRPGPTVISERNICDSIARRRDTRRNFRLPRLRSSGWCAAQSSG